MYRPPAPHIMGTMYRNPRPLNNYSRLPGPYPQPGFHYRPNRQFRPSSRNTTNSRNEEHWCETCDRGFPTSELLNQHKQQHQKCNIDGCQFVAHPKVITKHIQMQHSSGLYKKIANLTNPEEIEKWREERKKKYPTRTNIEKKAAECKEKIERGEKMALKGNKSDLQTSIAMYDILEMPMGEPLETPLHPKRMRVWQPSQAALMPTASAIHSPEENVIAEFIVGSATLPQSPTSTMPPSPAMYVVCGELAPDTPSNLPTHPPRILNEEDIATAVSFGYDQATGTKRRHNFDEHHQRHRNNGPHNRQYNINNTNNKSKPPPKKVPKTVPKVPSVIENNKLKPFAGILSINMKDEDEEEENNLSVKDCSTVLFEDDYYEEPVKNKEQQVAQEPALCGALTSLVCDYGSSDEEPNEQEKVLSNLNKEDNVKTVLKIISKGVDLVNKKTQLNNKDNFNSVPPISDAKHNEENSDDDGPEEVKTVKPNSEDSNLITQETSVKSSKLTSAKKNINCRNNNLRQTTRYKHKVPSTLLYKLLHKEIRKERNIVLQCIRYIRKMNYFEKTQ